MHSLNWTYVRQLYNFLDALLACFKHCTNTVSTVISITLWELKTGFQNRAPLNSSSVIRQKLNLKTGFWRKQSTPNFPKNKHLLTPDTHNSSENLSCLFSWNTRFEIRPFDYTDKLRLRRGEIRGEKVVKVAHISCYILLIWYLISIMRGSYSENV